MYKGNINKVLNLIKEGDKVLDIGGWAGTLNRATHVIDINPYETRNKIHQIDKTKEYYSKKTWIQRDVCDKKPLPFPNKFFNFVFCSNTLEDIRDPIWLCSEIRRIGKRGYLEFPSPKYELSRGVEGFLGRGYVGNGHHRWVIFIKKNKIMFIMKNHFLSGEPQYSIPYRYYKKMNTKDKISFIFFEKDFEFGEYNIWDEIKLKEYFEKVIRGFNCRSTLFWRFVNLKERIIKTLVNLK